MILKVKNAKYISEFKVMITFNDGVIREVDLQNELDGDIFRPLQNIDYFKSFFIDCGTISWSNGADFAPEYLYLISKKELENEIDKMVYKLYDLSEDEIRIIEGLA